MGARVGNWKCGNCDGRGHYRNHCPHPMTTVVSKHALPPGKARPAHSEVEERPIGSARGRLRSCLGCGGVGHRRKDCPHEKKETHPTELMRLPPRVAVKPGMRFRVVEDFEEPTGGPALIQDDVWVASYVHCQGFLGKPTQWIMHKEAGRAVERRVGFALYPELHPFQPVPAGQGFISCGRVGMGPIADQRDITPAHAPARSAG